MFEYLPQYDLGNINKKMVWIFFSHLIEYMDY